MGCIIVFCGVFISCSHTTPDPVFNCAAVDTLIFDDIKPIIITRCAVNGCHDGSNASIPTLVTEQDLKDNLSDSQFQIERGAMPPTSSAPLTEFEKAKLLCYIIEHVH